MMHPLARSASIALLLTAGLCPGQDAAQPAATPAPSTPAPRADPAAAKVLQDAEAAARALTSISYSITFKGDVMASQKASAEVIMLRDTEHDGRWLKRWIGTAEVVTMPPTTVQISDQGDTITYINMDKKEYHKDMAKYVNQRGIEPLVYCWIPEIAEGDKLNKTPFATYLTVPGGLTGRPAESVGDLPCDVVVANYGPNQPTRTWWFSKEDHLPRKLEWDFSAGGVPGKFVWEISNLKSNPPLVPAMFELPVPEGFKKFEPPPQTPVTAPPADAGGLQTSAAAKHRFPGTTVGTLAPDFTLPMIGFDATGPGVLPIKGKSFTLSAERASVIVLDFFGSWNAQSKAAAPELEKMAAALQGRPVKIISLAIRERDENKAIEFLSQPRYAAGLLPAADDVAKAYRARVIPSYFVVGFEGEIIYTTGNYARDATVKEMQTAIETYLGSHQPGQTTTTTTPATPAGDDSGDSSK
ncbi:MAG: TlpA family protein disulfide reductase [Phycisphaerales bacterium]|nr:TlpA family protein disulfide reductase [Phycisphaerales bacterium]